MKQKIFTNDGTFFFNFYLHLHFSHKYLSTKPLFPFTTMTPREREATHLSLSSNYESRENRLVRRSNFVLGLIKSIERIVVNSRLVILGHSGWCPLGRAVPFAASSSRPAEHISSENFGNEFSITPETSGSRRGWGRKRRRRRRRGGVSDFNGADCELMGHRLSKPI